MLQRDYHLFFQDASGQRLGHAFGPIPQIGFLVEVEPEPSHKRDLLVTGVKLHAGNISQDDAPTVSTVTVYCRVEADQLHLKHAEEVDVPALLRRGGQVYQNERKVAVAANN